MWHVTAPGGNRANGAVQATLPTRAGVITAVAF